MIGISDSFSYFNCILIRSSYIISSLSSSNLYWIVKVKGHPVSFLVEN